MSDVDDAFDDDEAGSLWTPGPEVRLHNGEMIPVDADFFHAPPAELGEIVTAHTSLIESKHPLSTLVRLMLVVGLSGAFFFGVAVAIRSLTQGPEAQLLGYIMGAVAAVITVITTILFTRFTQTCDYVGKLGIAQYSLSGNRERTPREKMLLFEDCQDITTWQTRKYVNGIYSGTEYKNIWRDSEGRELFTLKGTYHSEKGNPKAGNPLWFATSAEGHWNEFAFEKMVKDYESQGYLDFRVKKKDTVRVGQGFLEFNFGGQTTRLTPEDIKTLSLADGSFTIHTREARWFSRKGKFGFEYGGMGNAKLFLFALERLAGYSFS